MKIECTVDEFKALMTTEVRTYNIVSSKITKADLDKITKEFITNQKA